MKASDRIPLSGSPPAAEPGQTKMTQAASERGTGRGPSVGIICGAGIVSGKEIMALELGEGLRAEGCSVAYATSAWGTGDFAARLRTQGFPFRRMRLGFISATLTLDCLWMTADQLCHWPKLVFDYHRFLRQETPALVIHTNWHHLLLLRAFLLPKRDVFWLHEVVPDKAQYVRVFGWLARRMRSFIPVSHAVAESLRRIGIPESKIHVIHNGLSDPSAGLLELPVRGDAVNIGIVGQVGAWKGHEDLVEAFALIAGRHPKAVLHIFGPDDREFAVHLKQRAAALGIAARLVWHGFVGDRAKIYSAMDICVMPSRFHEPFGLIAVEAAFFGLPVVATRRGGLPEIIEDGVTGYLVEAERPRELAQRLGELLNSAELREKMGAAARKRAREHFSRERFVADFLRLLADGDRFSRTTD